MNNTTKVIVAVLVLVVGVFIFLKTQTPEDSSSSGTGTETPGTETPITTKPGPEEPASGSVTTNPEKGDEDLIPKEILLKYYQKDRKVSSVAKFDVQGIGSDTKWTFKGESHFHHVYRVVSNVEIESNDGSDIVFIIRFDAIDQTVVVSKESFELDFPDTPLLDWALKSKEAWIPLAAAAIGTPDVYSKVMIVAKTIHEVIKNVDPKLKRSLTWLADVWDINPDIEVEVLATLGRFDNSKFRVSYRNGFGVTKIEQLEPKSHFTDAQLFGLADRLSLFTDYALVKDDIRKPVGEKWKVNVEDVSSLFALGYDADVIGELTLSQGEIDDASGENISTIRCDEGTVRMVGNAEGRNGTGELSVLDGKIEYDYEYLLTKDATFTFNVNTILRSTNHLLFKTEKIRDLTVEARYNARLTNK